MTIAVGLQALRNHPRIFGLLRCRLERSNSSVGDAARTLLGFNDPRKELNRVS
jgi:hypothetical protein